MILQFDSLQELLIDQLHKEAKESNPYGNIEYEVNRKLELIAKFLIEQVKDKY